MRARSRQIFERAIARGEIPASTDADLILDLLIGAVFLRLLFDMGPLNRRVADDLVEVVLTGLSRER